VSWSTGSTGSRQRVRPDEILDYEFSLPDDALLKEYANITSPMFEFIAEKVKENLTLMKLRDLFIERLYSGQISILESKVA
jgi:type I restriction enzyme S subunit